MNDHSGQACSLRHKSPPRPARMMRRPVFLARQAGRPAGLLGRALLRLMAAETSRMNREVLDALALAGDESLLEVGYGHGRTLAAAGERAPGVRLAGIDVSVEAARLAARRCRRLIAAGSLDLRVGDSAELPWPDGAFDKAFAVHTLYFWREPARNLGEIRRVLRRGGLFVLAFRERTDSVVAAFPAEVYRFYRIEEVAALLRAAGFESVDLEASRESTAVYIARCR